MNYLREKREAKGLSQIETAKLCGMDRSNYFRYERGDIINIPLIRLITLIKVLDLDVKEIFRILEEEVKKKEKEKNNKKD